MGEGLFELDVDVADFSVEFEGTAFGERAERELGVPGGWFGGMLEWSRASGLAPGRRQQASAVQSLWRAGMERVCWRCLQIGVGGGIDGHDARRSDCGNSLAGS